MSSEDQIDQPPGEDERPTIAQVVEAFEDADGLDAVFEVGNETSWPSDLIDRRLLREKLLPILKDKGVRSPGGLMDDWYKRTPAEGASDSGGRVTFRDPEPWREPVNGEALLRDLVGYFERFLVAPPASTIAAALWVLLTHVADVFDILPFLVIKSPTKRCGKTTFLDLIFRVSARGLMSSSITGPALFRTIEAYHPTLFVDEADHLTKLNPDLHAILNAGHRRTTARVIRTVGEHFEPKQFDTFAPKAMTVIGRMPDTIEDRAILVPMERKSTRVRKEPAIGRNMDASSVPLLARAARWAADNALALRSLELQYLEGLNDRAADNWAPLLVIATLLGEDVLREAERAARELSVGAEESVDELLLAHCREAFGEQDKISTAALLGALVDRDDGPWAAWWAEDVERGQTKAPGAKLAKRLRTFGIQPGQVWIDGKKERGYRREAFSDAWNRYVARAAQEGPADGRTVGRYEDVPSDLQPTVLPFFEEVSSAYRPEDGRNDCPECGGTVGHMSACSEGGA
jgi:putative DNA primase/helicase